LTWREPCLWEYSKWLAWGVLMDGVTSNLSFEASVAP
jgi:hypothetical protein